MHWPPGKLLRYRLKCLMLSGIDINTLFQLTVNNVPGLMKSTSLFQKPGNVSTTLNIQIYIQVNTSWELELYLWCINISVCYISKSAVINKICTKYHLRHIFATSYILVIRALTTLKLEGEVISFFRELIGDRDKWGDICEKLMA